MVIVHVPDGQLVSIVIASPTFHAVSSSVSVDDQQSTSLPASSKGKNLTFIPFLVGFLFTSKLTLYFLPSIVVLYFSISLFSFLVISNL